MSSTANVRLVTNRTGRDTVDHSDPDGAKSHHGSMLFPPGSISSSDKLLEKDTVTYAAYIFVAEYDDPVKDGCQGTKYFLA